MRVEKFFCDKMDKKQSPEHEDSSEEAHLGPLEAIIEEEVHPNEPEPKASGSAGPQAEQSWYWLAQYFTQGKQNVGLSVMGLKYPQHWPKEKAETAGKEVQDGDKHAVPGWPLIIKQESDVIKLLPRIFTLLPRFTCEITNI